MALTGEAVAVVKATAPVVAENATKITSTFYRTMFTNNPEVLAFFNKTNQEKGRQQHALAEAVVAYATNIDNLGALGGLVEKIAHRHVALCVTAEMYPIVHANLMKAVAEVLGSAVTPEIAAGWSEAVLALAGICIGAEDALAKQLEQRTGGWRGQQGFRLVSRKTVAEGTVAFSFTRDGYDGPFDFTPGQYLTIRLPGVDAAPRHYTVTSKPGDTVLQCTTRRVEGGLVSTHMHDKLKEGDVVLLAPPCGVFRLKSREGPKVLVSAGIGITPSWAFLQQLGREHVRAVFHVDRDATRHAYRAEIESSGALCRFHFTSKQGRPQLSTALAKLLADAGVPAATAEFYVCGPLGFMQDAQEALAGLGAGERVFCEVFGTGSVPKIKGEATGGCPFSGQAAGKCPVANMGEVLAVGESDVPAKSECSGSACLACTIL